MKMCRHFGACGGCSFQDIPYERQLEAKKSKLSEAADFCDVSIIPSSQVYGFRNKMEYSFEGESLGLHPRGRFDQVIDLEECPVFSEWVGDFLRSVRDFAGKRNISFYSRREKQGVLRYLILRESKFTGEKAVILVVDKNSFNHEKEWAEMVRDSLEGVKSVVIARRHTSGDSAYTEDYDIVYGNRYIKMKAGNLEFDISPFAFFQPNSYQVENMYSVIKEGVVSEREILDLYSGIGSIPFFIADKGKYITGVEAYPACISDAKHNLEKIAPEGDVGFIESKVKRFLAGVRRNYDCVILDPPRGGMSYKVWLHLDRLVKEHGVRKIFYVCCSLKNLPEDIKFISENTSWKMRKVTGIDQFVHTPHLETIVEYKTK